MLRVGIEGEGRLTVTENDTAAAVGSGSLRVFATPAMGVMRNVSVRTSKRGGTADAMRMPTGSASAVLSTRMPALAAT